ncbi:flippase-like domain-containing protein [Candidatus Micrarchaeota archaeon]|nr:flippase-like domain-containing protein [Candidatus Micrarchaeota archaeon]MBU1930074.1 flippase-like domain-containing protein [Candidatus Micrarchaeota archaeon]
MRLAIKILIGIILLGMLYYLAGFANLAHELSKIQIGFLPIILFWFFASIALNALNIYVTARPIRKIPLRRMIQYFLYSWAAGFFGLGKVGELSIIYWLKKENLSTGEASAIALMDKFITFFTVVLLSTIGIWVFGLANVWQTALIAVGLLAISWLLLFSSFGRRLIRKILKNQSNRFAGFGSTVELYVKKYPGTLLLDILLTLGRWIALVLFVAALFASLGFPVSEIALLFVSSITTLISFIPISFNGLGVREAAFTVLAGNLNWPLATTLSVLTISLALSYAFLLVVLVLFAGELRTMGKKAFFK